MVTKRIKWDRKDKNKQDNDDDDDDEDNDEDDKENACQLVWEVCCFVIFFISISIIEIKNR